MNEVSACISVYQWSKVVDQKKESSLYCTLQKFKNFEVPPKSQVNEAIKFEIPCLASY